MTFSYDYYSRFEQPSLLLCHPDDTPIGMLTDIEDYKLELKFNEVSKLGFTIYQILNTEYIPATVTEDTVGTYYVFRENGEYETFKQGYYEEIILNGVDNDLTLSYFTEEVSYNEAFDNITERREILVEDLGYFIITDVSDESGDKGRYKSVSASSCDYELNYIEMPYLDGTYMLYTKGNWKEVDGKITSELIERDYNYYIDLYVTPFTTGTRYVREDGEYVPVLLPEEYSPQVTYYGINDYVGKDCLLYEIMRVAPHWTLKQNRNKGIASNQPEYVELASKYRTFSGDDNSTVYAFLKNKLQESFECFVKFDILNREIEICRYEDALNDMEFILNESNFTDECKIKTTIDDYTNALSVSASDSDLYMSSVNPLGTSTIYNFKHDLDSGFITSEYEEADVNDAVKWYFYIDEDDKYQPIYLEDGKSSESYDENTQYYIPTDSGTLAAALTIWQQKYDDASITYHGIDYDNWDAWVDEINRIKNWVTGDYYYASGVDGSTDYQAMLVVKNVVKIAGSIQTKKDMTIKWKPSYGTKYTLSPAPILKQGQPISDVLTVTIKAKDTTGQDEEILVTGYVSNVSSDSFGEVTLARAPASDDTVVFSYQYVPSVASDSIKYYYNYYVDTSITASNFAAKRNNLYRKGKYNFESCANEAAFDSSEVYFGKASSAAGNDYAPNIGRFVVKNDYVPVTPRDGDNLQTYYVWNGSKFIEGAVPSDKDNHKEGLPDTQYYHKVFETENSVAAKMDDIMEWINSNRSNLGNGRYVVDLEPDKTSYMIVTNRDAYGTIDQQDTYGKIFFNSNADNDFGGNISQSDMDYIANAVGNEQDVYVNFEFPTIEYKTEDGVPGVVNARLVQTKVDLELEDVISEVVGIVSTISGYTSQIKAAYDVNTSGKITPEIIETEVSQMYGFVADARADLIVALDKYRMLTADRELLNNEISTLATNLSFETFFANYFRDMGVQPEDEVGRLAKALYSKLIRFIRQQSYNEENITIEDNMSSEEKQNQELELYKYSVSLLEKLIEPTYTIDVDIESFPFLENYADIANNLDVGSVINIELQTGEVERFNLIGISIDYDGRKISLKFGNHLNDADVESVFEDLQTSAASASAIVASNYVNWGAAVDETTQLMRERRNILDATLRGITARNSSMRDNINIDTSGIRCMTQKVNVDGEYVDDYGLWISNGVIMFTDDGWQSSKMAVGRMVDANGKTIYGFNGDTILANTIAADKLVAGTLSSGNNMIQDGSFESYVNNNVLSADSNGSNNKLYKFKDTDPWSIYTEDSQQAMADPNYTGVITVTDNSDACLGERYLYVYRGGTVRYTKTISIPSSATYTISFYCKTDGSPSSSTAYPAEDTTTPRAWITLIKTSGGERTAIFYAEASYNELSSDVWNRFSNTDTLEAGEYTIEISSNLDTSYMVDGVLLEQSVMLNGYSDMPGENFAKYTVMDENGLRIYGGKISVHNNIGDEVIRADSNGNLALTGVITAKSGSNIAGWVTNEGGFYKLKYRDEEHQTGAYPESGLFVKDTKYGVVNESGTYYFKFIDDSYSGVTQNFPLLFTGFNPNGGSQQSDAFISSDNCNFYVDNDGRMKAVNATLTGTNDGVERAVFNSSGSGKTVYTVSPNKGNIMVAVNGLLIPEQPKNTNGTYSTQKYSNGFEYDGNSTTRNLTIYGTLSSTDKVEVYSSTGYAAIISYATITQVKITNADIQSSFLKQAYISNSELITTNITDSTMTDCAIKNKLSIKATNGQQVATIRAFSTTEPNKTGTSLLIDASDNEGNGAGSITIKAKSSSTKYRGYNVSDGDPTTGGKQTTTALSVATNVIDKLTGGVLVNVLSFLEEAIGINKLKENAKFDSIGAWSMGDYITSAGTTTKSGTFNKPIYLDGEVYIQGLDNNLLKEISEIYSRINKLVTGLGVVAASIPAAIMFSILTSTAISYSLMVIKFAAYNLKDKASDVMTAPTIGNIVKFILALVGIGD